MADSDYKFWNDPKTEDSIKWGLVRYLTATNPGFDDGQFLLSPEVRQADLRNQLVQNNHLIPNEIRDIRAFEGFFADISAPVNPGDPVYDQADFRTNGAPMPTTAADSLRLGIAVHSGPHADYTSFVTARVQEIVRDYDRLKVLDPTLARETAIKDMHGLQSFLKFAVTTGSGPDGRPLLLLNSQDPHLNPGETLAGHNAYALDNIDLDAIRAGHLADGASIYGDRTNYFQAGYDGTPIEGDVFDFYNEVPNGNATKLVADPFANWSDDVRARVMVRSFIIDAHHGDLRAAQALFESDEALALEDSIRSKLADTRYYPDANLKPTDVAAFHMQAVDRMSAIEGTAAAEAFQKDLNGNYYNIGGDTFRTAVGRFLSANEGAVSVEFVKGTTLTLGTIFASALFVEVKYRAETVDNPVSFSDWALQQAPQLLAALPAAGVAMGAGLLLAATGGYIGLAAGALIAGAGIYEGFKSFVDNYLEATKFQPDDEHRQIFVKIHEALHLLEENTWVDEISDTINQGVGAVLGSFSPPVLTTDRDNLLELPDELGAAWLVGLDAAKLAGNASDNVLVHYGYGEASGGGGDDTLIGLLPTILKAGEKIGAPPNPSSTLPDLRPVAEQDLHLIMDGGAGNDWLVTLLGEKAVTIGGLGHDWIFNTSRDGVIYGDTVDGLVPDLDRDATAEDHERALKQPENADNIWWWWDTTLMDARENDQLRFFGLPLVGGTNEVPFIGLMGFGGLNGALGSSPLYFDYILPFMQYMHDGERLYVMNALVNFMGIGEPKKIGNPDGDGPSVKGVMVIENFDNAPAVSFGADILKVSGDLGMTFRNANRDLAILSMLPGFPGGLNRYAPLGRKLVPHRDPRAHWRRMPSTARAGRAFDDEPIPVRRERQERLK